MLQPEYKLKSRQRFQQVNIIDFVTVDFIIYVIAMF